MMKESNLSSFHPKESLTISVDNFDTAYVINDQNYIFMKEKHANQWIQMPGLARDIAAGHSGVFVVDYADSLVPGEEGNGRIYGWEQHAATGWTRLDSS